VQHRDGLGERDGHVVVGRRLPGRLCGFASEFDEPFGGGVRFGACWLSSPGVAVTPGRRPGSCRPRRGRRQGARPGTAMTAYARTGPWTGTTGRSSPPWPGRAATCRARSSAAGPGRRSPPFACAHPAGCGPVDRPAGDHRTTGPGYAR
jgi:hypothetical protein